MRFGPNFTALDTQTLWPPESCSGLCAPKPNLHASISQSPGGRVVNSLDNGIYHHVESNPTLVGMPGSIPPGVVFARPAPRPTTRVSRPTSGCNVPAAVRLRMKTVFGSTMDISPTMHKEGWPVLCAWPEASRDQDL